MNAAIGEETSHEDLANIFLLLSSPTRIQSLWWLANSEMTVGDLAERLKISNSLLSQHLAKFRAANLLTTRRDGQKIFYSCDPEQQALIASASRRIFDRIG